MLKKVEHGLLSKAANLITGSHSKDRRRLVTTALVEMMPSWEGFNCSRTNDNREVTGTALETIECIERLNISMHLWPVSDFGTDIEDCLKQVRNLH